LSLNAQTLHWLYIISANKTGRQTLTTESLIVELDARTAKLDAKLNTTNDKLDKLTESSKKTDKGFEKLSKAGDLAGKAITRVAAAGLAASAALVAATAQAVSYAKELSIASRRSGENVERLQSLAFATGTVGISLEKLGDITKDTNEKVGEFLADGTGGFLDFVSVAKLTSEEAKTMADRFKDMTGPDILQAMVTRMEEAGATAKEMSFALEGMASDTTDLIPLLVDGGKAVKELEKEFNDLNITLTQVDIERIGKIGIEVKKLSEQVQGSSAKAVSVLSEEIIQITQLLAGSAQDVGGLVVRAVTGYQTIVVSATSSLMNMFREAEILALEAKSFIVGVFGDNSDIEEELSKLKESDALRDAFDASYLAEQWEAAKLKVSEYYGEIKTQEEDVPEITTPIEEDEDEDERISEKDKKELDALREFTLTRAELLDAQLAKDIERLELASETFDLKDGELYRRRLEIVRDYTDKKARLEKGNMDSKDKDTKTEIKWSDSAAKTQLDTGTKLLTSLGNNSKTAHKIKQGLAVGNTIMTTAENINEQFPNPIGMTLAGLTGAAQLAAIMSSTSDGGGSLAPAPPAVPEQSPQDSFNDQGTTITDISGGEMTSQRMIIEFNDEVVDALSRQIQKSQSDGRT
jgi:hypothetical protein